MVGKRLASDRLFDAANLFILTIVCLSVLYPLYFIIIASFSNPDGVYRGLVWLLPYKPSLDGYRAIFAHNDLWMGYRNSLIYTVVGTTINVALTFMVAFPLSRKKLVGRGFFTVFMVFTMYFNGGLIPTYLLVRGLGMLDTIWAMVLPGAVSVFNVVIVRTFIQQSIPEELYESAVMDGCGNLRYFLRILLPLSTAAIAVMILFYGVGHWNAYFNALIYMQSRSKLPLQLILREILILPSGANREMSSAFRDSELDARSLAELIKYGVIIVASVPVLVLYPFLQKYFVRGVMIGSLKG